MNGSKTFWADLSKKGGTWAGVATIGALACDALDGGDTLIEGGGTKHVLIGLGIAALRTVLGLAQGKVGDPATAKFDKHPAQVAGGAEVDEEGL